MAIQVICPGCHARFKVSDKFAGKRGPCPKCKAEIRIPTKSEEVVVHAPEEFEGGGRSTEGKLVLKPIARTDYKFHPVALVGVLGGVIMVLIVGLVLRGTNPSATVLMIGAALLAPPLVWGGYLSLRDEELEPYRGLALVLRVGICSVVYVALWGLLWGLLQVFVGPERSPEIWQAFFLIPPVMAAGAVAALATLDLDWTMAAVHYGVYLGVTVLMRLLVGLPPL